MNTFKSALVLVSCILTISGCTTATPLKVQNKEQTPFPDFSKESVGSHFSAEKIASLEERMEQFVSDGDVKGIATLLVKDGEVISHVRAGIRRAEGGLPIADDTIYRIYSMTKPVTGVAMMMLYEQGLFSLDDPVSKFIPEFEGLQVVKSFEKDGSFELEPLERQPTMRELMSHTAGFAYGLYGNDPSNREFMKQRILLSPDLSTFIDRVATVPLMFQPGEQWFYSASVDIQGAILERLTGLTLGEYLDTNIFAPLGMVDTGFFVPAEKAGRLSDIYGAHPETKQFQRMPFAEEKYNFFGDMSYRKEAIGMESGGGGLVSTMADYARFCQMLANGGALEGKRIIKSETAKLMRTNILVGDQKLTIAGTLTEEQNAMLGFGLNFGTVRNSGNTDSKMGDGSYFWGGAAGTWFWIDPVHNLYFIGMIQRFPRGGPVVDFRGVSRELVYEALVD